MSLSTSFLYIGVALLPLLVSFLTDQYGHSDGLLIFGALMWNCILCGVTLKPTPEGTQFLSSLAIRGEVISNSSFHFWDRYLLFFSSPFRHPKYAVCLTLGVASVYVYSSWAIFLVSFGESIGFSSILSIYLSTFGGIGGILGSWAVFMLFYYDKMNPFNGCFVPLVVNGVSLLASVCTTKFYVTAFLMFISGFSQGFLYATLCGFIPVLLCKYHLQQGVAIAFTLQGVSYQLGGLISGECSLVHKF
ncbi:hypothetical protein HOLleu_35554 [Holothuria leucospilota]|uniref:Uncharacterized protein n=1 Tax=Holothuria leucospilota TaxID=206669 RepID=A0A9Q0YM91_HOLLE|nr:hypothetical protein HOLleu_35554 [Holothuria leucospilota]